MLIPTTAERSKQIYG